jgi:hypothetical protein
MFVKRIVILFLPFIEKYNIFTLLWTCVSEVNVTFMLQFKFKFGLRFALFEKLYILLKT